MEFLEDMLKLAGLDADAGIPHLDPKVVPAPPAPQQDAARARVFHRIAKEIAHHLFEQARIALHPGRARHEAQR